MKLIPLQAVPNQFLTCTLNQQICGIVVRQLRYGLYIDLYVNGILIIGGVICENDNRVVRSKYLGFDGDLLFHDTQGSDDPDYTGLGADTGARFQLYYLTADEVAQVIAIDVAA